MTVRLLTSHTFLDFHNSKNYENIFFIIKPVSISAALSITQWRAKKQKKLFFWSFCSLWCQGINFVITFGFAKRVLQMIQHFNLKPFINTKLTKWSNLRNEKSRLDKKFSLFLKKYFYGGTSYIFAEIKRYNGIRSKNV